jgi:hypothetical protein
MHCPFVIVKEAMTMNVLRGHREKDKLSSSWKVTKKSRFWGELGQGTEARR